MLNSTIRQCAARGRGSGLVVDPERVREARIEAGLSLAQLARDDVSRTFIHFVETGQSRPSQRVLALIARRTGKPISYFMAESKPNTGQSTDLAADLIRVGERVRKFAAMNKLTKVEREAMTLIAVTLGQGAELAKSVQTTSRRESSAPRAAKAAIHGA